MSSSFGSLLHLFRVQQGKLFSMLSGYQQFGLLVLSSFLLMIGADSRWSYSDVDIRNAERQVIPHYVRHGYEYPDIDIKKIMQQRGMRPKPYQPQPQTFNRGTYFNQESNGVNNRNQYWRSQSKALAQSNHLEPRQNHFSMKKNRYSSKYLRNQQHDSKSKMKRRY